MGWPLFRTVDFAHTQMDAAICQEEWQTTGQDLKRANKSDKKTKGVDRRLPECCWASVMRRVKSVIPVAWCGSHRQVGSNSKLRDFFFAFAKDGEQRQSHRAVDIANPVVGVGQSRSHGGLEMTQPAKDGTRRRKMQKKESTRCGKRSVSSHHSAHALEVTFFFCAFFLQNRKPPHNTTPHHSAQHTTRHTTHRRLFVFDTHSDFCRVL